MAQKDEIFEGFIDDLEKSPKPKKKGFFATLFSSPAKQEKRDASSSSDDSFYDESMDFIEEAGDNSYEKATTSESFSGEEFVPTLKNLFGFKWWEFSVIVIEFFLILYMALVLLKLVPLF
jgi:hypothetical protein